MTNTLGSHLSDGERLELIRNGEVFDWAEAGWFGTHADGPGFQGFEKLTGHRFHMQGLDVEAFQVDDEIRIHPPAQMVREKRVPNVWERRVWGQFIWPIDSHEGGLYPEHQ